MSAKAPTQRKGHAPAPAPPPPPRPKNTRDGRLPDLPIGPKNVWLCNHSAHYSAQCECDEPPRRYWWLFGPWVCSRCLLPMARQGRPTAWS